MVHNLTRGSVLKNIIRFSAPFLLSYFLQTMYGMADLFIAGQFYGAGVISAISNGSQIMHMLTVCIVGLAMGTTVLIGKTVGAENRAQTEKVIGNSCSLFLAVSVFLTVLLLILRKCIISAMKIPPEALTQTNLYLTICFLGIPFITAYNVIASVFRGLGDSKSPMIYTAVACIANIALDYLFMGVFKMQAEGAALATVIAQAISVFVTFGACKKGSSGLTLKKTDFMPDRQLLTDILKIGFPITAQDGFIQVSFLVITVIANRRGVEIAAAVGIVEKIICFLFLVPSSMLSAISALTAQNIGAGEYGRTKKTLLYGICISCGIGLVFAGIFQFVSAPVISLFTNDEEIVRFGAQYLKSYVFDCFFAAIHFSFSGFFCAYGLSGISFLHNAASIILLRIPGAWLASKWYPDNLMPMGCAAPAGSAFSAVICIICFFVMQKRFAKR